MNSSSPLPGSRGEPGERNPHGASKSRSVPDRKSVIWWISAPLSGRTTTRTASFSSTTLRHPARSPTPTRHLPIGSRDRLEDVPVRGQATVDGEVDAGDPRGVVGGEKSARRRDLIWAYEAAQRDAVEAIDEVLHHPWGHSDLRHLRVR